MGKRTEARCRDRSWTEHQERLVSMDYAKTIAFFFMAIIHVIEEMSNFDTVAVMPSGFLQHFIEFGAGPLVAPVFMFSMGACIVLSKRNSPRQLVKRGLSIWVLALALNLIRDVVPGLLASALSGVPVDPENIYYQAFRIDILHFAAMALLLTALLKKLKTPVWAYIPIAVLMQIAGNGLEIWSPENKAAECLLSYLYSAGELAYFPLLTWYIWPAVGITAGEIILKVNDKDRRGRVFIPLCLILLAGYLHGLTYGEYDIRAFYALYEDLFYDQTFLHLIFNTLVIVLEFAVLHVLFYRSRIGYGFCRFCGSNINTLYVVQWMIVGWTSPLKRFRGIEFSFGTCILIGLGYAVLALGITWLLPRVNLANLRFQSKKTESSETTEEK